MGELAGLFIASFASATLLLLPSEAALFAYLKAFPESVALAVAVATLGNTLGGMTTFYFGRLLPAGKVAPRAIHLLRKYGAPVTVLAWVPIIGDALVAGAGWLRIGWLPALCYMTAGRLARYIVIASLAL